MNRRPSLHIGLLCLAALLVLPAALRADKFFDLRGGIGWLTDQTRVVDAGFPHPGDQPGDINKYNIFAVPVFDLLFGWDAEPLVSVVRLNISLSGTNTKFFDNGAEPAPGAPFDNTLNTSRFRSKNYSLSFSEYWPLPVFDDLIVLSPCVELKLGHYLDPSAGQEFVSAAVKPASDHWFSFLKLGLKVQLDLDDWSFFAEYRYPVLGLLTDGFTRDNRREDAFWGGITKNFDQWFVSLGYEGTTFLFSNTVLTGFREKYLRKSSMTLSLASGVKF
jgi:hypothetical protein